MRKSLSLIIFIFINISLVSLETKADTGEMKTIENETYNWKMKIPKCWELYPSFTEKDLKTRHLLNFVTEKCKKKPEKIKGLTVQYYYFPLDHKKAKLRHRVEDITIGGRPAIAYLWFGGSPRRKGKEKFQAINWYVKIPCQKGHRALQFRDIFNVKDIDLKKETVKNFPTPLLRKIASTFECT